MIDELLDKANRYVYTHGSRVRSAMKVDEMARIASDGTEDLSKMRWQFGVMIKKHARYGASLWQRIVKVFGVQAVVGHTVVPYLEDDRLQVSGEDVPDSIFACIAHNTEQQNLESIIINDIVPSGS